MTNPFSNSTPAAGPNSQNLLQGKQQAYQTFVNDPVNALSQVYSIPDKNITLEQAYQHLLQTGQITQQQVMLAQTLLPQLSSLLGSF